MWFIKRPIIAQIYESQSICNKKNSAITKVNNNVQILLSYLYISWHFKNAIVKEILMMVADDIAYEKTL